jgi:hypothetical protein
MQSEILQGKYVPHMTQRMEMEQQIAQFGSRVLNNFWLRMPGKDFGDHPEPISGNMLELETAHLELDKPYEKQRHIDGGSDLYLSLTPRQFYQIIYMVMEEFGITKEKAIQLRENIRNNSTSIHDVNVQLIPAYLKLIEMGFSDTELSI